MIRIRVMQVHFFWYGWMGKPNERTCRTTDKSVALPSSMKSVGRPQPVLRPYVSADRTGIRAVARGFGPVVAVRKRIGS